MSSQKSAPFLLTPHELKESAYGSKVVTLDATWFMPNSPRKAKEEFFQKRLPSARFIDLDVVASPHGLGLKHMMPTASAFAKACSAFGIEPDTHVVIYDAHGVFSAPRALFTFRAFGHNNSSILDGGLPRWEVEGLPVESGASTGSIKETTYPEPSFDEETIKSYEQVVSNAELNPTSDSTAALVVDARSHGRFTGKDPEPRPGLSSGHIPHSFSLPFTSFLQTHTTPSGTSYTTFLSTTELSAALVKALGEKNAHEVLEGKRKIVTTCGSGMSAAVLWLGLRLLDVEKPGLYDESWTGYAARSESKIVKDV